ncbi:class I SAM-dependent methyltransferase [Staphylothermus hellenicus]|uniref:Methyltransferase type 11 n=1 Tax=Staphylothermus hellenicus (strain DSM 12710 / JCM 10830 / BK20S6-10-b1 / P8) TaxID=591019 RepID=D7DAL7_STAHD|nr:class I SAM-dependent methyltransferase [Staphylothermus hellenicus]ADI31214.1 Methyltransferase type 11 [Staphylothermus hellenicus DSM 12710]
MGTNSSFKVFDRYHWKYENWYLRNYNIMKAERDCIKSLGLHGKVLDVGVGTGILTYGLSKSMVGVDPSEKMLLYASRRGFLTINSFGEELPFIDGYFDTVIVVVTICFVNDPLKMLAEINRVLKKNGTLVTCVVPKDSSWGIYYNWLKNSGKSLFYRYARFYTIQELFYMLSITGFIVKDTCSTLSYPPGNPPAYEVPIKSLVPDSGFICIRAEKK